MNVDPRSCEIGNQQRRIGWRWRRARRGTRRVFRRCRLGHEHGKGLARLDVLRHCDFDYVAAKGGHMKAGRGGESAECGKPPARDWRWTRGG